MFRAHLVLLGWMETVGQTFSGLLERFGWVPSSNDSAHDLLKHVSPPLCSIMVVA